MKSLVEILPFFYLVFALVCGGAGIFLFCTSKNSNKKKWLALCLLLFAMVEMLVYLMESGLIIYVPHLYRTGLIFLLLYLASFHFFLRSSMGQASLKWADLLHLVPAVLYIIDLAPFFFSAYDEKLAILRVAMNQPKQIYSLKEGWLFSGKFYILEIIFLAVVYAWLQFKMIARYYKNGQRTFTDISIHWQAAYFSLHFLIFLPYILLFFSGSDFFLYKLAVISIGACIPVVVIVLLFYTSAVEGFRKVIMLIQIRHLQADNKIIGKEELKINESLTGNSITDYCRVIINWQQPLIIEGAAHLNGKKPAHCNGKTGYQFTGSELESISGRLCDLMRAEQPFLKPGYTVKELADRLSMPAYQLSAFINQQVGVNFNHFINRIRINYCQEIISRGKVSILNLSGLAGECGFSNRNTFSAAFKKFTGIFPSEYIRKHSK